MIASVLRAAAMGAVTLLAVLFAGYVVWAADAAVA